MRRRHFHRNYRGHRFKHQNRNQVGSLFYKVRRFVVKHPVFSSIISIIAAIILFRIGMGSTFFGNDLSEFRFWFLFFAVILGIVGLIALKVWFKNNVAKLNTKHVVEWRRR